jgi:lipopolysaccharide transport system permease protein
MLNFTALQNWSYLAWSDIEARYRRTALGPFWISLTTILSTAAISVVYSILLKQDIKSYFSFLALGMITWQFISTTIVEQTTSLTSNRVFLLNSAVSPIWISYRIVIRNLVVFLHSFIVILPIVIYLNAPSMLAVGFVFLAILVLSSILWVWGNVLSMLSVRYGDVPQLVNALMGLLFLLTPVLWSKNLLTDRASLLVDLNPFAKMLEIFRQPLLDSSYPFEPMILCLALVALGAVFSSVLLSNFRTRIIPWL